MHGPDITRRRFLGLAAAGAAGVVLAGCGDDGDDGDGSSSPSTAGGAETKDFGGRTITTAVYSRNHASSPLYWRQFAPPGLNVEVKVVTSAGDVARGLASGDLDFGLQGYFTTLIDAVGGNIGAKVIGMCSRQGAGIIARTDSGVRTIPDLRGKRVGVPPPGVQTLLLTAALDKAGMRLDRDVTAVPLGFAEHGPALERGDIDAYVGTEPNCTQSVVSGRGVRVAGIYDTPAGDVNTFMWAAPKNLNDPDLLRAAAKMQRDAAELLTPRGVNDPTEWRKLLVEQFEYPEEVYRTALENVGAEWRFDDRRRSQFEGAADLMVAQGIIPSKPRIGDLLLLDYQPAS
ncbi:MAG: ABC transporter substrate-binding protein [Acidimicrobiia bacterium]